MDEAYKQVTAEHPMQKMKTFLKSRVLPHNKGNYCPYCGSKLKMSKMVIDGWKCKGCNRFINDTTPGPIIKNEDNKIVRIP